MGFLSKIFGGGKKQAPVVAAVAKEEPEEKPLQTAPVDPNEAQQAQAAQVAQASADAKASAAATAAKAKSDLDARSAADREAKRAQTTTASGVSSGVNNSRVTGRTGRSGLVSRRGEDAGATRSGVSVPR